jgi:16S rRNA G966 N2-methylase RsmD
MRLEGRTKAGFYPTPLCVVDRICSYITNPNGSGNYRILDPCCGTGEPLESIAKALNVKETYGIEIDKERANSSKSRLLKVIHESYANVRTPERAYSLLFLNPPYDTDEEWQRLEYKFLIETTHWLAPGGLLVYLIPHNRLIQRTSRYLAWWYKDIKVMRFPDEEYEAFKQIVIFGIKKDKYCADEQTEERLRRIISVPKEEIVVIEEKVEPQYTLPSVNGRFWFRSVNLDPEECYEEIKNFGLWNDKEIQDVLFPVSNGTFKPLMPLRKGHLAMLIAAGLMDNLEVSKAQQRYLIKGRTEKKVRRSEVEEEGNATITETEYVVTNISALDLVNGEILTIE